MTKQNDDPNAIRRILRPLKRECWRCKGTGHRGRFLKYSRCDYCLGSGHVLPYGEVVTIVQKWEAAEPEEEQNPNDA